MTILLNITMQIWNLNVKNKYCCKLRLTLISALCPTEIAIKWKGRKKEDLKG